MAKTASQAKPQPRISIMDTLLYILAGSAMVIISISFLLWLRF